MKVSDYDLPREGRAEITAAETLITYCKSQLRLPDSAEVVAFAKLSDELQQRIVRLRKEGAAKLKTDRREVAAAVHAGGGQ